MRKAELYRKIDQPTKSGAYGHAYEAPVDIWISIHQRSDFYNSQGIEKVESDHTGITRESKIKHQDKIKIDGVDFLVKTINKNTRYSILGLRRVDVESQQLIRSL